MLDVPAPVVRRWQPKRIFLGPFSCNGRACAVSWFQWRSSPRRQLPEVPRLGGEVALNPLSGRLAREERYGKSGPGYDADEEPPLSGQDVRRVSHRHTREGCQSRSVRSWTSALVLRILILSRQHAEALEPARR